MRSFSITHYILIGCVLLLSIGLFSLPKKILTNPAKEQSKPAPNAENEEVKSIEEILQQSITPLTETEQATILRLQKDLSSKNLSYNDKQRIHKALIKEYLLYSNSLGAAYHTYQLFLLTKNNEDLANAAKLYYQAYQNSVVPQNKSVIAQSAAQVIDEYIKTNPGDDVLQTSKVHLAECYVEGMGAAMQGVPLLREVLAVDSNNVEALFLLGKMSIQSGQLDKAVSRFSRLIELRPDTLEYYLYLAQVFSMQGSPEKAAQTLAECRKRTGKTQLVDSLEKIILQNQ